MKLLIFIFGIYGSSVALAEGIFTTVDCSTANGKFSGSQYLLEDRQTFSGAELKDILLKGKQSNEASLPYPDSIVVSPEVRDLQILKVKSDHLTSELVNTYYFTLLSANFMEMHVFCTVSQVHGACPPSDLTCQTRNN
jgi:hypothetical protein